MTSKATDLVPLPADMGAELLVNQCFRHLLLGTAKDTGRGAVVVQTSLQVQWTD